METRRVAAVGGILLILLCVGCGNGGGGGGDDDDGPEGVFALKSSKPADGQTVSPDLSETKGRIEIRFSEPLDADSIVDEGSSYGLEIAAADFRDTQMVRVPGKAEVDGRRLRFTPDSDDLAPQQYTFTLTTRTMSQGGQSLAREGCVSFTVGPDVYEPIIRRTSPVHNQQDVPIDATLHVWFNEPLDPTTVNASTVVVLRECIECPIPGAEDRLRKRVARTQGILDAAGVGGSRLILAGQEEELEG